MAPGDFKIMTTHSINSTGEHTQNLCMLKYTSANIQVKFYGANLETG